MSTLQRITALVAPIAALGAFGLGPVPAAQAAPADEALTIQLKDVRYSGLGDDVLQAMVAEVQVCLDDLPAGDRDGVVTVTHDDFTVSQEGIEGRQVKPWDGIESEMISDDEGFPREVFLAEGECATGKLPFEVAMSDHVTPGTTTLSFTNDYGQFEEFLIS